MAQGGITVEPACRKIGRVLAVCSARNNHWFTRCSRILDSALDTCLLEKRRRHCSRDIQAALRAAISLSPRKRSLVCSAHYKVKMQSLQADCRRDSSPSRSISHTFQSDIEISPATVFLKRFSWNKFSGRIKTARVEADFLSFVESLSSRSSGPACLHVHSSVFGVALEG